MSISEQSIHHSEKTSIISKLLIKYSFYSKQRFSSINILEINFIISIFLKIHVYINWFMKLANFFVYTCTVKSLEFAVPQFSWYSWVTEP